MLLLLHSVWLCFTLLAIEGANVTSSPKLNINSSSIIPNTKIQHDKEKIVIYSDSVVLANSSLSPKNESTTTNLSKTSPDAKHSRGVTNTSVFTDQLPSNVNISSTIVPPKNVSAPAIPSVPTTAAENSASNVLINSTSKTTASTTKAPTTSTTTTTTTTPTTTTTTTTTKIPKKPTISFSVEDQPDLLAKMHSANPSIPLANESTKDGSSSHNNIAANASPSEPILLQSSETISLPAHKDGRAFIVPMVAIIFIIPLLVILANFAARRVRDCWSKRKYRRMDYLIEEMYH